MKQRDWYSEITNKPIDVAKERYRELHPKSEAIIKNMDKSQFLTYIYTGIYEEKEWEGVATIITACNQRDFRKLVKYIFSVSLESPSIIRVMIYTLSNIEKYRNGKKFYLEVLKFKNAFEKKFKDLLFEIGQLTFIDKIDLINLFRRLIFN
mgnify:CR=1 FL=1